MWGAFAPALLERMDAPGTPDTPTFSLFALAMQGQAPSFVTDALFANIAAQQRRDGSWSLGGFARAPMEESDFARTAMAVYALTAYAPPGRRKEMDHRRTRARIWLEMHKPRTTEDRVWRLAGLKWAGAMPKYIRQAGRQLELMQHSDGGWSPSKAMASDAYATATALWALSEAGNVELNGPAYRRGARYLLSTQQADGTWLVRSRAPKFQPYFESGFPYGGDQWVSAAATAWAAAALAPAAGPRTATD
jgi:hypothetical protein